MKEQRSCVDKHLVISTPQRGREGSAKLACFGVPLSGLPYLPSSMFGNLVSTALFGCLYGGQLNSDMLSMQCHCGCNPDHVRKET